MDLAAAQALVDYLSVQSLRVDVLDGIQSVGVQGDNRTYTPALVLSGPFPGYALLDLISRELTSRFHVNRVTFELARVNM